MHCQKGQNAELKCRLKMKKESDIPENSEENFDKFAPNISAAGKENPFIVPEDYFDNLPAIITSKYTSPSEELSITEKAALIFRPKFYVPLATVVSVIIVLIIMYNLPEMKTEKTGSLAYTSSENTAEMQYLETLIDDGEIEDSDLINELTKVEDTSKNIKEANNTEIDIERINASTVILSDSLNKPEITDDDIILYLLENDDNDDTDY